MRSPNTRWADFILACAVAHLPNQYVDVKDWLPSQLGNRSIDIFAINMVLQYAGISRWKDYLYGEFVCTNVTNKII